MFNRRPAHPGSSLFSLSSRRSASPLFLTLALLSFSARSCRASTGRKLYYGWVNLLINIQPLDPAFPRWPIKKLQLATRTGLAAGCRRARGWRLWQKVWGPVWAPSRSCRTVVTLWLCTAEGQMRSGKTRQSSTEQRWAELSRGATRAAQRSTCW